MEISWHTPHVDCNKTTWRVISVSAQRSIQQEQDTAGSKSRD